MDDNPRHAAYGCLVGAAARDNQAVGCRLTSACNRSGAATQGRQQRRTPSTLPGECARSADLARSANRSFVLMPEAHDQSGSDQGNASRVEKSFNDGVVLVVVRRVRDNGVANKRIEQCDASHDKGAGTSDVSALTTRIRDGPHERIVRRSGAGWQLGPRHSSAMGEPGGEFGD